MKWKKNIPNMLSAFRLILVPVFIAVYFSGLDHARFFASCVYGLASITDFLDGHIARKYDLITNLGRVLDPLGDKMMTLSVIICITIDRLIPLWVICVVAFKEMLMGVGGLIIHKKACADIPSSNYIGKASTVIFFVVCVILMLFYDVLPGGLSFGLIAFAVAITLVALGGYVVTFMNVMRKAKDE